MEKVTEVSSYQSIEGHHPLFTHKRQQKSTVLLTLPSYIPVVTRLLCTWTDRGFYNAN